MSLLKIPWAPDRSLPGRLLLVAGLLLAGLAGGCGLSNSAHLAATRLPQPGEAPEPARARLDGHVQLSGAGGEWLDFVVLHTGQAVAIRVAALRPASRADLPPQEHLLATRAYRVADLPATTRSAAYMRLYGGSGGVGDVPRALVPLGRSQDGFALPPESRQSARLWVDLQLPRDLPRGQWETQVEALGPRGQVLARLPVHITAHGFNLPTERRLVVSAPLEWERLEATWPDRFEGMSPILLSRQDPASQPAVERLDQLVRLAQQERLQVTVPELGGPIKWPAGRAPEAYWDDYDSLILPWLRGEAFADGVGLSNWPAPRTSRLESHSAAARVEYWQTALSHLADAGVLERAYVRLDESDVGRDSVQVRRGTGLTPGEWLRISEEAGRIASAYPLGRIAIPLEADQVRFTGPENPGLFPPEHAGRLIIRGDGLVTDRPQRPWPAGLALPESYMDLEGPTPAPVPGPGASEADVRLWGWLAFLRGATHLEAGPALPRTPDAPVDPTKMIWFYPGELFGVDEPVPSIQLKWLRRAQQDYEYLALAAEHLEETYARVIARALVRPVRVQPGEPVDPLLPLVAGTPDPDLWRQGLELVAGKIALADPALRNALPPRYMADHTNRTTAWLAPRELPVPIVTATRWDIVEDSEGQQRLHLRVGASVYNPSDARPEGMSLSFVEMPGGESAGSGTWTAPGRINLPAVATYEVGRFQIGASVPLDVLGHQFRTFHQAPLRLAVRNEFIGAAALAEAVAPAVVVDRRRDPPVVDGRLGEWEGNEAIIDGRMVLMHARPALQEGQIQRTDEPAQAFVAWTDEGLYIAFRFNGVPPHGSGTIRSTRNFVETQYRRVWGEDVCEVLIQPVWLRQGDPEEGPLLHVVCKPDGAFAQRRLDRRTSVQPWQTFESGMRYAATVDEQGTWRAEVMLPWSALGTGAQGAPGRAEAPALVRFNLSHHEQRTGQSASWAGPVDFGRDEQLTGALLLRQPERVGFSQD